MVFPDGPPGSRIQALCKLRRAMPDDAGWRFAREHRRKKLRAHARQTSGSVQSDPTHPATEVDRISQADGVSIHLIGHSRSQPTPGHDVDPAAQCRLKVYLQTRQVQQRAPRFEIDQEIDIRVGITLPTGYGTKNTHVVCAAPGGRFEYQLTIFRTQFMQRHGIPTRVCHNSSSGPDLECPTQDSDETGPALTFCPRPRGVMPALNAANIPVGIGSASGLRPPRPTCSHRRGQVHASVIV